MPDDLRCFSHEHLFEQIRSAEMVRGHYTVQFFEHNGLLSRTPTESIATFYFYPSAGTIRDSAMNIVYYSSLIDKYNSRYEGG